MHNEGLLEDLKDALDGLYVIERELPRGGMSRVFVATEVALGRHVVIKVLSPELAATLSAERFKREIQLAARLQHPHIIPLLSAGEAATHLYYTMPLVDGDSLRERMSRMRPMPIPDVIEIVSAVARALHYAHEQGVAHRDIKPENVMFFHDQAVVLDFGIGKALENAAEDFIDGREALRITMPGTSLGTPTYIAPEQASGDPALDHRADLYALGVVAYEMITGHPPFAGRSPQQVMQAHASRPPDPIGPRRPDAPAHLVAIVMQALAKSPAHRPASGNAIAEALDPRKPRPSGPIERLPTWAPWAIAGVTTLIALALGAALLLRGA